MFVALAFGVFACDGPRELGPPAATEPGSRPEGRRVIVLGFDGVDPDLVREYIADGDLPHLARLSELGTLDDLGTTNPAESPVSWASFAVGGNPGRTNIFDFLYRLPESYQPDIALAVRNEYEVTNSIRIGLTLGVALAAGLLIGVFVFVIRKTIESLAPPTSRVHRATRLFHARIWGSIATVAVAILVGVVLFRFVPDRLPYAGLARQGTAFWEHVGESGKTSSILQVPVTFPALGYPNGRLLTGLGTPDVRASWGTFAIYASRFPSEVNDPVNRIPDRLAAVGTADSVTGGKLVHLLLPSDPAEEIETFLYGPDDFTRSDEFRRDNPQTPTELRPPLFIQRDPERGIARFRVGERTVEAPVGGWTDWLLVDYELNPLITIRGMVRFYVRSIAPDLYVYASPINFDPTSPPPLVPLSAPRGFSNAVTRRLGQRHETVGWAIATNPLKDELIDEEEFLQDLEFSFARRWSIIESELAQEDWSLLVGVMLAPDRVQHMFWRYLDPEHPRHDPDAPPRFRDAIRNVYRRMDAIVGQVMDQYLDDRTDLFVISDHGFASYRKGVHLNSWLVQEGFMTLRDPGRRDRGKLADVTRGSGAFANVDWSRTRAYSLGLGKIYLNRLGREPRGVIEDDEEADRVAREIIEKLEALTDPDSGERVVHAVYRREDIYRGPYVEHAGDLVVGFRKGYRVSWDTAAGQAPEGIFELNLNNWCGAHCSVDPSLVAGFIATNRALEITDPSIIDLARTILGRLGLPVPDDVEGRDLLKP